MYLALVIIYDRPTSFIFYDQTVHMQMTGYLRQTSLLPEFQSVYCRHHSTESAVLNVLSDIVDALDRGNLVLLSFLDLSAAFGTVNEDILRQRRTWS